MTPEMWRDLERELNGSLSIGTADRRIVIDLMRKIERRTLPERMAKLLAESDSDKIIKAAEGHKSGGMWITNYCLETIIHVLRSGDTTEIEKWVEK